jgi:hypothetical protein
LTSPAKRAFVAFGTLALLAAACGDDEPAAPSASVMTSLPSLAEWCATFEVDRPAAASPNPDGQELEVLDLHIAHLQALAAGAPGVTEAATTAAGEVRDVYVGIRQRVADGEQLPDVLTELWSADTNDLVDAARALDTEAEALC